MKPWFAWLLVLACLPAHAQVTIHGVDSTPATPVQVAQSVSFNADASASAGGPLEYRWDFGDGTPRTPWLPTNTVSHAYQRAGVYTVLVQVRHATLGLASATRPIVVRLVAGPRAKQSAPILVHPSRREVWVANPDHGSVAVLDADALTLLAEIPVGAQPSALAVDAGGQVWANAQGDDALHRIDPVTRTVGAGIALGHGARPVSLLFDAAGTGYVGLAGRGSVGRFHVGGNQLQGELAVAGAVEAMALRADGSALFVSRLVSKGDAGTIWRIALPAFAVAETIDLPLDAISPDSGTAARGLPNYVGALALAEDGTSLWYGAKKDNMLRGLFREGQPLTFETSMRSLVGRVDGAGAVETVAGRIDLDNAGRVSALLLVPGSSHLFAAQETNNRVVMLDPWNRAELGQLGVGAAPRGLAFDPATSRLFVQNFLSRSISVFDVGSHLVAGTGEMPLLAHIASAGSEPLGEQVLRGKRVFHDATDTRMTQDGYFSCAACHLDGRGDGRVWDFTQLGEGLRNTTSLLGSAGMGRGLVHWSGNFDEIQDFEVPIRNLFGGTGFLADADYFADDRAHPLGTPKAGFSADLDALAAYVATLDQDDRSPHRQADGSLTADGQAGRALFVQLDCQRCHAGPAFTDSPQGYRHDVGTLTAASGNRLGAELLALDTPTLRGLFGSAPYLHDGSAADLHAALLARNPDGRHGNVAALTTNERNQLVSFLLQIDAGEPAVAAAAQLEVAAPNAGSVFDEGASVSLSIATDLPQIVRVDYRIGATVIASATASPWQASWIAGGDGPMTIHADMLHDQGRYQTLSPPRAIRVLGDHLFADGFEVVTP